MKKFVKLMFALLWILSLQAVTSCKKSDTNSDPATPVIDPFNNGTNVRNMIVVISDIHLGADTTYAECIANRAPLVKLIKQIKSSSNVKELVIAGDLVDEWFVPSTVDTYQGGDQADFVDRLANANKEIFDALNSIIQEGIIRITYVPGNHDLAITAENIERLLPGVNQSRDDVQGLGTYSPADFSELAIEHGHRYNFFCAPDPYSNQDIAPGTIMPPGYFFTRIAALAYVQNNPPAADTLPVVTPNLSGNESQNLLYKYWKTWSMSVKLFPNSYRFDENIIVTNVNGFTGSYSINDLVPFQTVPGGYIDDILYNGIQDHWDARQTYNHVAVHSTTEHAIDSVMSNTDIDDQSSVQYFLNPDSHKRIVVFGHTHAPRMNEYVNSEGKKCIYANSGTWIDNNPGQTTMNFVVITPQNTDASIPTSVKLYNFEHEIVTLMDSNSVAIR